MSSPRAARRVENSRVCLRKNDVELLAFLSGLCAFQLEEDELRGVALLVFANKQDLPRAMSVGDVAEALRLSGVSQPVGGLGSAQVGECFLPESCVLRASCLTWQTCCCGFFLGQLKEKIKI